MASKIFCFINSGKGTCWQKVVALAEDGTGLAGHISSSEYWAKYDIGIDSDCKHDKYKEHYPEGYELVWVDDPKNNKDVIKAYKLNQEQKNKQLQNQTQ